MVSLSVLAETDPEVPRGVHQSPKRLAANLLFRPFFFKNCMELIKKMDRPEGAFILGGPLNPSFDWAME